ncbi:MAG: PEP-CTERM sorting domain-containing protein [Phycisphaerae bacterium]|jgi:hypothetical protein
MRILPFARVALLSLVMLALAGQALGAYEPTPQQGYYRDLRSNYNNTWYIFNDSNEDGILNPGDTYISQMKNWWTPVSSGSQGLYNDDPNVTSGDLTSAPMNWATYTLPSGDPNANNPNYNYWLPRANNAINFYMSYSQFDNCTWDDPNFKYGSNPTQSAIVRQRHEGRGGWNLGWVIGDSNAELTQTPAGTFNMTVAVHDGGGTFNGGTTVNGQPFGTSISNPQVSMSNDINPVLSLDKTLDYKTRHPAIFDDANGSYTWAVNQLRMTANGYDANDLTTLVNSQELKEVPGFNSGKLDACGHAYLYQDAFTGYFNRVTGATDGGVLAGLSGYNKLSDWSDQQVIRIMIDANSLKSGGITQVNFFDFGDSNAATWGTNTGQQVNPKTISFYADAGGNLFMGDPNGDPNSWVYFSDNIIYIATTNQIPEPATLCLLALGAGLMVLRRRRR